MSTAVKPDAETIEHLDFEEICQVKSRFKGFPGWHPCGDPAKWVIVMPCCGHQCFECEPHHNWEDVPVTCQGCKRKYPNSKGFRSYRI